MGSDSASGKEESPAPVDPMLVLFREQMDDINSMLSDGVIDADMAKEMRAPLVAEYKTYQKELMEANRNALLR